MIETISFKIAEKLLTPYFNKLHCKAEEGIALIRAILKAYKMLLDKSEELGIDPELFRFHLDETLFRKKEFIKKYLGFFDPAGEEDNPDAHEFYEIYCGTIRDPIPKDKFVPAFDYFFDCFCNELRHSKEFQDKDLRRILNRMDTYVSQQEVSDYIDFYCKNTLQDSEERFMRELCRGEKKEDWGNFEYVNPKIEWITDAHKKEAQPVTDINREILSLKIDTLVFTGNAGVGKTMFMRYLEKEFLRKGQLAVYLHSIEITSDTDEFLKDKIRTKLNILIRDKKIRMNDAKMRGFVNHILRHGKLVFIIDAYDQVSNVAVVNGFITDAIKNCAVIAATRPARLNTLIENIKCFTVAVIKNFDEHDLKKYFGENKYFDVWSITRKAEGLINIPLLAKLIKRLLLNYTIAEINSKTDLYNKFIDEIVKKQADNDVNSGMDREVQVEKYRHMLMKLEDLSLKLIRAGKKERFMRDDAREFLRELALMKKAQMISLAGHVLDIESVESLSEEEHKFHHSNFQEYFAAKKLLTLYRGNDKSELFRALNDMARQRYKYINDKYEFEICLFFSELIENCVNKEISHMKMAFDFWQNTLMNTDNNWIRTYALQIRDKLGERKGNRVLAQLFEKEQEEIDKLVRTRTEELKSQGLEIPDDMMLVPAGKFIMGSYEGRHEKPVRRIELDDFIIKKYPVTNKEYKEFIDDNPNYEVPKLWDKKYRTYYYFTENHPVVFVNVNDAEAYCDWKTIKENSVYKYRLPTSEEWEKASRGIYGRRYPWGNEFYSDNCNTYESNKGMVDEHTTPVYQYPNGISPYGCYDMVGNVWEWTDDFDYVPEEYKLLRGGSWDNYKDTALCAIRSDYFPDYTKDYYIGFRWVRRLK